MWHRIRLTFHVSDRTPVSFTFIFHLSSLLSWKLAASIYFHLFTILFDWNECMGMRSYIEGKNERDKQVFLKKKFRTHFWWWWGKKNHVIKSFYRYATSILLFLKLSLDKPSFYSFTFQRFKIYLVRKRVKRWMGKNQLNNNSVFEC